MVGKGEKHGMVGKVAEVQMTMKTKAADDEVRDGGGATHRIV